MIKLSGFDNPGLFYNPALVLICSVQTTRPPKVIQRQCAKYVFILVVSRQFSVRENALSEQEFLVKVPYIFEHWDG